MFILLIYLTLVNSNNLEIQIISSKILWLEISSYLQSQSFNNFYLENFLTFFSVNHKYYSKNMSDEAPALIPSLRN